MQNSQGKEKQFSIARAELSDKGSIMALARQVHEESAFSEMTFSEKKFSAQFDRSLTHPERCITLKAEWQGSIAGFLYCNLGEYFIADDNLQANVHVVYVKSEFRESLLGGKIAVKLVRGITKWAKHQGVQHVFFYVTSGAHIAQTDAFFRKMGLTTLGGNYVVRL